MVALTSIEIPAKEHLNCLILNTVGDAVLIGPFKGMKLSSQTSWADGNYGTKLLGCYEQELHSFLEEEISRLSRLSVARIVDIGCAEGYYAVGMAKRLENATVWAFDNAEDALRITQEAATLNGVQVFSDGFAAAMERPDLVISDCEGAEVEYLDLEKYPGLEGATILVECHDSIGNPITDVLRERFRSTHTIELITEGARDPNQFEFLRGLPSLLRWLAVCEGRPCMMWWLILRPK